MDCSCIADVSLTALRPVSMVPRTVVRKAGLSYGATCTKVRCGVAGFYEPGLTGGTTSCCQVAPQSVLCSISYSVVGHSTQSILFNL